VKFFGLSIIFILLFGGCAGKKPIPLDRSKEITALLAKKRELKVIRPEPIYISAEVDAELGLDNYDVYTLFNLGNDSIKKKDYPRAIKFFKKLVEKFPESIHLPAALFNLGLALEQDTQYQEADKNYQRLLSKFPNSKHVTDARFRQGECLLKQKRYSEAQKVFSHLANKNLPVSTKLEAISQLSLCLIKQKNYSLAEDTIWWGIHIYSREERKQSFYDTYIFAKLHYMRAEVKAGMFADLKVPLPKTKEDDALAIAMLEKKAKLLLAAQKELIKVIRVGNTYWATAAGYRVGSLYHKMYQDIIDIPKPEEMGSEERDVYTEMMSDKIKVLLKKAVHVFTRVLWMAERTGERNPWVKKTRKKIDLINKILQNDKPSKKPEDHLPPLEKVRPLKNGKA